MAKFWAGIAIGFIGGWIIGWAIGLGSTPEPESRPDDVESYSDGIGDEKDDGSGT